jgi:hypothetical protein
MENKMKILDALLYTFPGSLARRPRDCGARSTGAPCIVIVVIVDRHRAQAGIGHLIACNLRSRTERLAI